MKTVFESGMEGWNRRIKGCAGAILLMACAGSLALAQTTDVPVVAPASAAIAVPARPVMPWIDDVVKMNAAGIPTDVIKNYVANAAARSNLRADDIIFLRDHGVPSDIITAMIEHGASAPAMVASAPVSAAPPAPLVASQPYQVQPYQPTYMDQSQQPDYNDYSAPYGYNYAYDYPGYYPYYPSYLFPYTIFVSGFRHNRGEAFFRDGNHFRTGGAGAVVRNSGAGRTTGTVRVSSGNSGGVRRR